MSVRLVPPISVPYWAVVCLGKAAISRAELDSGRCLEFCVVRGLPYYSSTHASLSSLTGSLSSAERHQRGEANSAAELFVSTRPRLHDNAPEGATKPAALYPPLPNRRVHLQHSAQLGDSTVGHSLRAGSSLSLSLT
ncbi:hypothetical protein CALVIDRAFT_541181 [Calocera viscosa TUFC12733]|uniref:Uncharacterized protein n=1 Tax=Calocera viscosa (strain TUFC12733) TaxID=1330018 RepID=A0A167I0A8_CALVF|nr:hypothetical protein CALVIDRAFT_541181 [Calocera viscosa TUFC12733]